MSNLFWSDDEGSARGRKFLLATIAYDSPDVAYTASIASCRAEMRENGYQSAYALLSGNCHVDDARNRIVKEFLASDCTDLIFIDADVSFNNYALEQLLNVDREDVDIVGGVYPKRADGFKPFPVRMLPDVTEADEQGLLEVEGLPTGFMRIPRYVLERMSERAQQYRSDAETTTTPILFERTFIDGVGRVGGDINFCLKARALAFNVHAHCEIYLGHTAKKIVRGSMGSYLRRMNNETLQWVCSEIRNKRWLTHDIEEAVGCVGNPFGVDERGVIAALKVLEQAPGPVIEFGSGLSTILMAAANPDEYVFAVEHDPIYFELTKRMAREAGVKNIGLCFAPIDPITNWYAEDELESIPETKFRLMFVDGPPRVYRSRMEAFGSGFAADSDVIIADDCDSFDYKREVHKWADENNRNIAFEGRLAIMSRSKHD